MAGEEAGQVLLVEGGVAEAQPPQGERRTAEAQPVGEGEVAVPDKRAGEVQRRRQRVAPQPGDHRLAPIPGRRADHRDGETLLQRGGVGGPDALQEALVGAAATQVDVLTVVEGEPVAGERPRRTAEARPRLEEGHRGPAVEAADRRRQPGEPAADDHDVRARPGADAPARRRAPADAPGDSVAHEPAPARLRAATQAFSQAGSEMR